MNDSYLFFEKVYLIMDEENLSFASSILYVCGDGSFVRTAFLFSSSTALGFTIFAAKVLLRILSISIGLKCEGVSSPLKAASSVYPPPSDFYV